MISEEDYELAQQVQDELIAAQKEYEEWLESLNAKQKEDCDKDNGI